MIAINNRLNAVAEFGDVVPACVVSLCGDASAEIARLQAQVDALAVALRDISAMTYDSWTNGAIAKEIADRALSSIGR